MKLKYTLASLLFSVSVASSLADDVPAFPGAEGFARYTTTGGRTTTTGRVYHVTRLADDTSKGSLRWALKQTMPGTIVFDVSGYIDLTKDLNIPSNCTIAGQTAPGDGITLRYYTVKLTGCDNVIIRFIRFRRSQVKDIDDGADATWGRQHKNIILDHCSFSWSIDELASFYDNKDFTMQWCMLGEALRNPGHSKGEHSYGGIWGGKGASFHHNMLLHMQHRVPRFNGARYNYTGNLDTQLYENCIQAERVDFRNCLMYNWGTGSCYGGPGGGQVNMVNNYYKGGPATSNPKIVTKINVGNNDNSNGYPTYWGYASRYYINGNYVAKATPSENYDWKGVVCTDDGLSYLNGEMYIPDANHYYGSGVTYTKINNVDCVPVKMTEPIECGEVTTHSAQNAYEKVLQYCGASLVRDAVDARYAEEARTGTYNYIGTVTVSPKDGSAVTPLPGIIDLIQDPSATIDSKLVAYPELNSASRASDWDTDQDGIPDEWEDANGLDKNNAADAVKYTLDSKGWYTNLEVYLNSIVEDIVKGGNADADVSINEYYPVTATAIGCIRQQTSAISKVEYFTLDGMLVDTPQVGVNIRRITYSNGTITTDKVIKKCLRP